MNAFKSNLISAHFFSLKDIASLIEISSICLCEQDLF